MSSKCHWFFFHRNQIEQILENDGDFSPIAIMLKCIKMMLTLCPMKLRRSKYVEGKWIFRPSKLHRKNYVEITRIFWPSKLRWKKYVETTCIFRPSKLHRKNYVEIMWIFWPSKLRSKKYVETTCIFRREKLHRKKVTWEQRGYFDHRNYAEKVRGHDVEIRLNSVFKVST